MPQALWNIFARPRAGLRPAPAGALALLALLGAAPATQPLAVPTTAPTTRPQLITFTEGNPAAGEVLYLPGISAYRSLDRGMLRGLVLGGQSGRIEAYDWPAYSAGLGALLGYDRNRREAAVVARVIEKRWREDPKRPFYIVAHSGGTGIAIWGLELLPPEVMVDQVILLAPALSPTYDLSAGMKHVRGRVYSVTSPYDPVLGTMTRTFGTIDRVQVESAGLNGFVRPASADAEQYKKLSPMPYRAEWERFGHTGDHIGSLERDFGKSILAPLLVPAR